MLQTKSPSNKIQKTQVDSNDNDDNDMFELVNKTSTKNVNDIIAAWRYRGESLIKEKTAIDDFIDRKLVFYYDLVRLSSEYAQMR